MTHDELKAAFRKGARIQAWHLFPIAYSSNDGRWVTLTPKEGAEPEFACAEHLYRVHPDDLHLVATQPTKAEWDARMVLTVLDVAGFIAPGKLEQAVAIVEDLPTPQPATPTAAADSERLDFMVRRGATVDSIGSPSNPGLYRVVAFGNVLSDWHRSAREAIDAAMQGDAARHQEGAK